eukprot:2029035-Prymnesium_polylepis.2
MCGWQRASDCRNAGSRNSPRFRSDVSLPIPSSVPRARVLWHSGEWSVLSVDTAVCGVLALNDRSHLMRRGGLAATIMKARGVDG